jgi:hypothetical protein
MAVPLLFVVSIPQDFQTVMEGKSDESGLYSDCVSIYLNVLGISRLCMTENRVFSICHTVYHHDIDVTSACQPGKEGSVGRVLEAAMPRCS